MSPRRKLGRVASVVVVAALLMLAEAQGANASGSRPSAFNQLLNEFDAAAVGRATAGASGRLRRAECLKVLTDFKDRDGRTLDLVLETWGLSASEYLERLPYRDGSALPHCRKRSVEMFTSTGLPPVFLCPAGGGALNSRFAQVQIETPALAEYMVIHEMLHTLGLGENPPTTFEITDRVRRRCQ